MSRQTNTAWSDQLQRGAAGYLLGEPAAPLAGVEDLARHSGWWRMARAVSRLVRTELLGSDAACAQAAQTLGLRLCPEGHTTAGYRRPCGVYTDGAHRCAACPEQHTLTPCEEPTP